MSRLSFFGAKLADEGEGEVAFFSAKRWDRRNRADPIKSATLCHDAEFVVGSHRVSYPLRMTAPTPKSVDYNMAPQSLHKPFQWIFDNQMAHANAMRYVDDFTLMYVV